MFQLSAEYEIVYDQLLKNVGSSPYVLGLTRLTPDGKCAILWHGYSRETF